MKTEEYCQIKKCPYCSNLVEVVEYVIPEAITIQLELKRLNTRCKK